MLKSLLLLFFVGLLANGLEFIEKTVSLKPFSICCDIPELADSTLFEECSNRPERATCTDVQCAFDKLGLLLDKETLNKEAFREHLQKWSEKNQGWKDAVHKVIEECVEKENPRFSNVTCKANDVFRCTGISLLMRCPTSAWKCGNYFENTKGDKKQKN